MKFTYSNSTQIVFGQGTIARLAKLTSGRKKILVVYGGGSIKKNGVYDQIAEALKEADWIEFSGVEPNPRLETLDKAVALVRESGVDFILAVGGGSVIDGCKYVAAAALYDGEGWDIPTGKHRASKALPLGAVLTLPATGSESNTGSVITREATKEKRAWASPAVRPQFAVLDPDVVKSLPERQLANGIADAFIHVCEQYLTRPTGALVQEGYSEVLLRTLASLAADFENRDDDAWRANLMWAANQALSGIVAVGVPQDWATHMIGHELTALYGVDHGRSLTIVQPALLRALMGDKRAKLEQLGRAVFALHEGPDLAERTVETMEGMYRDLGLPTTLAEAGIDDPGAADAVAAQLTAHGLTALGENRSVTPEVSRAIIQAAI